MTERRMNPLGSYIAYLVILTIFVACFSNSGENSKSDGSKQPSGSTSSTPSQSIYLNNTGTGTISANEDHIQLSGTCELSGLGTAKVGFQLFKCQSNGSNCDTTISISNSMTFYCENRNFFIIVPRNAACENVNCNVQAILYSPSDSSTIIAKSNFITLKFLK